MVVYQVVKLTDELGFNSASSVVHESMDYDIAYKVLHDYQDQEPESKFIILKKHIEMAGIIA